MILNDRSGNQYKIIGIIPSRMASMRLPGKPLADICGKPLLQRVWEAASRSHILQRIVIATDDSKIADLCFDIGAEFVMTPSELPSGTDRIKKAYDLLNESAGIVVNIQGDEPLLDGTIIDELLVKFINSGADVGTLIQKMTSRDEINDDSVVKVDLNSDMTAKNFSRKPIPAMNSNVTELIQQPHIYWKHIGVYAYKIEALKKFVSLPMSESEKSEHLEQLRLLETGAVYYCVETGADLIGIDTPADLEKIRKIFSGN